MVSRKFIVSSLQDLLDKRIKKGFNINEDQGVIYTGNPKILKKFALVSMVQLSQ